MNTIHIAASREYDVLIGHGLLDELGTLAAGVVDAKTAAIVSDDSVFALYGKRAAAALELLLCEDPEEAEAIVAGLEAQNAARQKAEQDILQGVLPDVAWHNNIRAEMWRKLAVNCVINPLTALWDCPNGELRHHPEAVMAICQEVAAVIEREGHHTSADDLRYYVDQVIESTAENISSMLQDMRALRHTEIDYITGYLLKRARAHGIAVPENARLFEMVKRKESEYERIGTGLPRPW